MRIRIILQRLLALAGIATVGGVGCGDNGPGFVALQRDFAGYRGWTATPLGSTPVVGHPAGPRIAYVNHPLPAGASEYPAGTIIVKEIQSGSPGTTNDDYELFAMIKRGAGYNAGGAAGWEFALLRLDADFVPQVVARGENPASDFYGGSSGGSACNVCHGTSASHATDSILDPRLQPHAR